MAKKTAKTNGSENQTKSNQTEDTVPAGELAYPELDVFERSTATKRGPITPEEARRLMKWETEPQYKERMVANNPDSKPEQWFYGEVYHCEDSQGNKVRCVANANNRPFDLSWCDKLTHTILTGQWAGPLTIPGETINGETVRIGRYGRILSGQHQLTALILADEELQASRKEEKNAAKPKYPFWNGHEYPVLETLVVTGLSEDERVLRTIDYVKPRSVADMLFTMELFKQSKPSERKELTKMLAAAIDCLWDRTDTQGYKTHPEVVGFLERHRKLLDCVEHLFSENSVSGEGGGRRISKLHLSPGLCSGLLFLEATSGGVDPDTGDSLLDEDYGDHYRNPPLDEHGQIQPPSEKGLNWDMWDKAREFWVRLASGRSFQPVRNALADLLKSTPIDEDNKGLGGRIAEKLAVLSRAWEVWKMHPGLNGDDGDAGPPFTDEDNAPKGILTLSYGNRDSKGNLLPNGRWKLIDKADFDGIDCPVKRKKGEEEEEEDGDDTSDKDESSEPTPPTPEEIAAETERLRLKREEDKKKLLDDRRKRRGGTTTAASQE